MSKETIKEIKKQEDDYRIKYIEESKLNNRNIKIKKDKNVGIIAENNDEINNEITEIKQENKKIKNDIIKKIKYLKKKLNMKMNKITRKI